MSFIPSRLAWLLYSSRHFDENKVCSRPRTSLYRLAIAISVAVAAASGYTVKGFGRDNVLHWRQPNTQA